MSFFSISSLRRSLLWSSKRSTVVSGRAPAISAIRVVSTSERHSTAGGESQAVQNTRIWLTDTCADGIGYVASFTRDDFGLLIAR